MSKYSLDLPKIDLADKDLLTTQEATKYLSLRGINTLSGWRCRDRQLLAAGKQPLGPTWIALSPNKPLYRRSDLEAWLQQRRAI